MKYADYLRSPEWRAKADAVLERDRGRCRRCDAAAEDVHHLTYERIFCEDLDDLIALCRTCHELDHKRLGLEESRRQEGLQRAAQNRRFRGIYS